MANKVKFLIFVGLFLVIAISLAGNESPRIEIINQGNIQIEEEYSSVEVPMKIMGFEVGAKTQEEMKKVKFRNTKEKDLGMEVLLDMNETKPEMKVCKFQGEACLGITLSEQAKGKGKKSGAIDAYEVTGKDDEVHIGYVINETHFKWDINLNNPPEDNCISFDSEMDGLDCFYQPPLYIENGMSEPNATCNATDCQFKDGEVAHRPEEVVGAYACYHNSKSGDFSKMHGRNYATGKAFDIPKPIYINKNGERREGTINITGNTLTLCIDKTWYSTARKQGAITIDPIFGYDTTGGSTLTMVKNQLDCVNGTASSSGTVTSVTASIYYYMVATYAKVVIQSRSSFTKITNGVGGGVILASGSLANQTFTFSTNPDISAAPYFVCVMTDGSTGSQGRLRYDTGSNYQGVYDANSYTSPADIGSTYTNTTRKESIWATYEEPPPPVTAFTVTIYTPANSTFTNNTQPVYYFNASGSNTTYNCSSVWNTTAEGTNSSVTNGTNSSILTNPAVTTNGYYIVNISCTNGTVSNNSLANITIDTIAPNSTITSPLNNSWTNLTTIDLTFSLTETNPSSINCSFYNSSGSLVNSTANTSTGAVHCYSNLYVNGVYTFNITSTDLAGNVNQSRGNFTRDATSPTISITSPTNSTWTNASQIDYTYSVTETNINLTNVSIYNSTGSLINSTTNTSTGTVHSYLSVYPDGYYIWNATTYDLVGNVKQDRGNFTRDATSPTVVIDDPDTNEQINTTTWEINLTVTEANLNTTFGTNCTVKNSTGDIVNTTMNASTGAIKCYLSIYQNGTFNITATAKDIAGNIGTDTNTNISQTIYTNSNIYECNVSQSVQFSTVANRVTVASRNNSISSVLDSGAVLRDLFIRSTSGSLSSAFETIRGWIGFRGISQSESLGATSQRSIVEFRGLTDNIVLTSSVSTGLYFNRGVSLSIVESSDLARQILASRDGSVPIIMTFVPSEQSTLNRAVTLQTSISSELAGQLGVTRVNSIGYTLGATVISKEDLKRLLSGNIAESDSMDRLINSPRNLYLAIIGDSGVSQQGSLNRALSDQVIESDRVSRSYFGVRQEEQVFGLSGLVSRSVNSPRDIYSGFTSLVAVNQQTGYGRSSSLQFTLTPELVRSIDSRRIPLAEFSVVDSLSRQGTYGREVALNMVFVYNLSQFKTTNLDCTGACERDISAVIYISESVVRELDLFRDNSILIYFSGGLDSETDLSRLFSSDIIVRDSVVRQMFQKGEITQGATYNLILERSINVARAVEDNILQIFSVSSTKGYVRGVDTTFGLNDRIVNTFNFYRGINTNFVTGTVVDRIQITTAHVTQGLSWIMSILHRYVHFIPEGTLPGVNPGGGIPITILPNQTFIVLPEELNISIEPGTNISCTELEDNCWLVIYNPVQSPITVFLNKTPKVNSTDWFTFMEFNEDNFTFSENITNVTIPGMTYKKVGYVLEVPRKAGYGNYSIPLRFSTQDYSEDRSIEVNVIRNWLWLYVLITLVGIYGAYRLMKHLYGDKGLSAAPGEN